MLDGANFRFNLQMRFNVQSDQWISEREASIPTAVWACACLGLDVAEGLVCVGAPFASSSLPGSHVYVHPWPLGGENHRFTLV